MVNRCSPFRNNLIAPSAKECTKLRADMGLDWF
jgi:hypothetical protein